MIILRDVNSESYFRISDHDKKFGHFINNKWVHPEGRNAYETTAPATGQVLASTIQGTSEDVNQGNIVVSIEFSPLCTIELTNNQSVFECQFITVCNMFSYKMHCLC